MNLRHKTMILASTATLALAACTTDGPNQNRRAQQGAVIGGLTGVAAGVLAGGSDKQRRNQALIAGTVGAVAGAAIGNALDKQEQDLRNQMSGDVKIVNTGDRLIVTMPNDILFPVDSAALRPDLQRDLQALASNLQSYPNTTVQVIGHADWDGEASYNLDLSQRRASSVALVLINSGVAARRVQSFGRGEDQPIATNLTAAGKALNRRVEIVILPNA